MKKMQKGFTLIELMIVVAIIAIIAAIAIPNLLRSRLQSNESAAVGNLRTIVGSQVAFHAANNRYAQDFGELTGAVPPFLDGDWNLTKQGYNFQLAGNGLQNFDANADPSDMNVTGTKGFYTDASAVIRFAIGGPAGVGDDPIGETP